jgi:acetyl-CoA carboxylase carboxyl transferase subunit beta
MSEEKNREWFQRGDKGLDPSEKKDMPDGVWLKCTRCGETLYKKELERNFWVCGKCDFHFRIGSSEYLKVLADAGSFEPFNENLRSADPLKFKDSKKYSARLKEAIAKTGLNEAVCTGSCSLNGLPVILALMDFSFIGGSMGSVVGEKISRAADRALAEHKPLITVSSSGGARMQEAALSLMQMAKTSSRIAMLFDGQVPFISILTDPTTGGTTASFAMLGDIILAEPGALIAFAGPRVIKQTIGQDLPEGFQRSEFLLQHGFVDAIVSRKEMKTVLTQLLSFFVDSNQDAAK